LISQELNTLQHQLKQNIEQCQQQNELIENLKVKLDQVSSDSQHKSQLLTQKTSQLEEVEKKLSEKVKEIELLANEVQII
jgi:predicted RNase H-like nuclease (RuvC/YqgF family)